MIGLNQTKSQARSSLDTGWGLIYRLNSLLNKAEDCSLNGDFDRWNFILDRLFTNLCYKGGMDIKFDEENPEDYNKIISIKLPLEEEAVFKKFRQMIRDIKLNIMKAVHQKNRKLYENYREELYKALLTKDIWLRKVMMDRGLYLKEFEFDPSKAMWGG